MQAQATAVQDRSTTVTTGSVTSRDGTTIGYRRLGSGPGVVLLHGAMESGQSHLQLAEKLAAGFTVYLPDRRGRGLSGPFGSDYSVAREVEDLNAVLRETGAGRVLGVSSGALITLRAALTLPNLRKVVIFEPPLLVDGPAIAASLARLDAALAQGNMASALVTGMLAAQIGPAVFNYIPRRLLEPLTNAAMAAEDKKAAGDSVTMRTLAPTLHYDFQLIAEMEGTLESFKAITAKVLLLGGSKSPAYLRASVDGLARMLPNAARVEFPGLGHGATGNTDRGGKPELVAQTLRQFYG
jgi:pimeloyl-ACP methyl ester carboxylesterase